MRRRPAARPFHLGAASALAAVLTLASGPRPPAQTVGEAALKAAFVNTFAKFTEWPAGALAAAAPLTLCVMNDSALGDSLRGLTRGQRIAGHGMEVVSKPKADPQAMAACRVLYVSGIDRDQWTALLATIKGEPILTVSDIEKFGESGGVVQLLIENGRVTFAVNLAAAKRARLSLSANVLGLARFVKDDLP